MGTDEPTFSELLDRARKGDPDAKALLFHDMAEQDEAGSQLLAMARKALPRGDPARDLIESRDLVQSALRSGWLDLSSFRGTTTAQLMSWMRTVLRRKLSRTIRKRQPRIGKDEAQDARGAVEGGEAAPTLFPFDHVQRVVFEPAGPAFLDQFAGVGIDR